MKKIFNGTPHAVNIMTDTTFRPEMRKHTGGFMTESIPSTKMLSAMFRVEVLQSIERIPVISKKVIDIDPLPEGYDVYIVSALYATACVQLGLDTSKVFTVADPVYTDDGKTVIGCRGICPVI